MNEFENGLFRLLSVLLFFGGLIMTVLGFDFVLTFPAMIMGVLDLLIAKLVFPINKVEVDVV